MHTSLSVDRASRLSPIRLWAVFLLLPYIVTCGVIPGGNGFSADGVTDYTWYADIPGIAREEIAAIEKLRQDRPEGLSYAMLRSDEAFILEDGSVGGFARLVCEHLSQLFGIPVTPVLVDWAEFVTRFDRGEYDLSGTLTSTPERRKKYRMTSPIAERVFSAYHLADREDLDFINSQGVYRLAFLEGSLTYRRVVDGSEVPFRPVFVANYREGAEALRSGRADAVICEGWSNYGFEEYPDIARQKYYPLAFTTVCLSAARKELFPVVDVFQKYLKAGGDRRMAALYAQGTMEYMRHRLYARLTTEERDFIDSHIRENRVVSLAAEFDNYPISFYNHREKAWQGVAHDVLAQVSALTGLGFSVVTGTDEEWSSVIRKLEAGEAAMVTQLVHSKDRTRRFLWSETPYMHDKYALLSGAELPDVHESGVRLSRVGLIRNSAYAEVFHRVFPMHLRTEWYGNTLAAFEALDRGEIDLAMMNRNLLLSATSYMERPDFKVNVPLNLPCDSYFGFHLEQEMLRSIIDKVLPLVDCEAIADQWQRKSFNHQKMLAEARIPYLVGITVLLFTVLALTVVIFGLKHRATRILSLTDHLTLLPNRRWFDVQMRLEWEVAIKYRLPVNLFTIDVDYFKRYNDTFGHPQGDLALRTVAQVFRNTVRRLGDKVARVGGEEFCVVLPNIDARTAYNMAERIRKNVQETIVEGASVEEAAHVTVSIGVATGRPTTEDELEDFIELSDRALYRAKRDGRNCVRVLRFGGSGVEDSADLEDWEDLGDLEPVLEVVR